MMQGRTSGVGPLALSLSLLLPTMAACGGGSSSDSSGDENSASEGVGTIGILATDAPLDHDLVDFALLHVDRVDIHRLDTPGEEWQSLYSGQPFALRLTELRNGVTQDLVAGNKLEAGSYDSLRLGVVDAELMLVNGKAFQGSNGSLRISEFVQDGLELRFSEPLVVEDGSDARLLLDFDLSKMFEAVPPEEPLDARHFILHPSVRISDLARTGALQGIVLQPTKMHSLRGSDTASVYLMRPGEADLDQALTSTASESDGSFVFLGVEPGIYDLIADKDDFSGLLEAVRVDTGVVGPLELRLR